MTLRRGKWMQLPIPAQVLANIEPGTRAFDRRIADGFLRVVLSPPVEGVSGWHLSISHNRTDLVNARGGPIPGRYPTWDEIVEARYEFLPPDIHVAMMLPPRSEYVNEHETCFHLYQVDASKAIPKVGSR